MKIAVFSDLHLDVCDVLFDQEPWASKSWADGVDLAIIAGDVAEYPRTAQYLCRLLPENLPTVFVPGNHEAYGATVDEATRDIRRRLDGRSIRVTVLDNQSVTLRCGTKLIGSTLWTDFRHAQNDIMVLHAIQRRMADFCYIDSDLGGGKKIIMPEMAEKHAVAREFIAKQLSAKRPDGSKTIVVTHHAPIEAMTHDKFRGGDLNPFFVADMEDVIKTSGAPDLWICGHTHARIDREIGGCRFINWCGGYPGEFDEPFKPLLIDVP